MERTKKTIYNETVDLYRNWEYSFLLVDNYDTSKEPKIYKSITALKKGRNKVQCHSGDFEKDLWNILLKCYDKKLDVYFSDSFENTNYQSILNKFLQWVKIHDTHRIRTKRIKIMKKKHSVIIKRKRTAILTATSKRGETIIL
jgi:hypothetical protein